MTRSESAGDCPDAPTLAEKVAQIAGKPVLTLAPSPTTRLSFSVEMSSGKAGYSAVLRAKGSRSGVRNIDDIGNDCSGLADAIAVTLAIILDDEHSSPPPPVDPVQSFQPQPSPSAPAPSQPAPVQSAPEARPTFWRPFAGAAAMLGVLESSALAPMAGLDIDTGHLVMGLEAFRVFPQHFDTAPGNTTIDLWAVGFHACYQHETDPKRTRIALCAHFTEGSLHGEASGFSANRSASRPWTAPGVASLAGGEIAPGIEWLVRLKLFAPLRRERFVIDNVGTVHETPLLGGYLAAGLAIRIE